MAPTYSADNPIGAYSPCGYVSLAGDPFAAYIAALTHEVGCAECGMVAQARAARVLGAFARMTPSTQTVRFERK